MTARCEECRYRGITGRDAFAFILPDRQRVTLCLSHAGAWRLQDPRYAPVPYGPVARAAVAARSIVAVR